ncbi:HugZ family heme oxygenase [Helicobacter cholecystus]|uniref:HugZ family heme oxygenase n=1 Tax=Helicobacter cholecystus TaxID=45498 RepID=UPI002739B5C7|nr:HugZ family heme oxygenase [Helicobacter cholecystus]
MIERIISHMNDHHKEELIGLAKRFGGVNECKEISLASVDLKGLDICCDGKNIRVDFAKEVSADELKDAIIALCTSMPHQDVKQEMLEFRNSFGSIILSTLSKENLPIVSYAPLLKYKGRFFIYISEVADHYASLRANPNALEVLFLEDECKAKSVILRKRLKYKASVEFKQKDAEFEEIFSAFEESNSSAGGLKSIKNMKDFHLIELYFKEGRFVKGFGGAYDIDLEGNLTAAQSGNPHQFSKN